MTFANDQWQEAIVAQANGTASGATTIADGGDTTQGAEADTALTTSASSGTLMAFTKGLVKIFADVWDSTNHLFASNIKQIGGQTPTLDNTTILATSMRGKNSVAGDTPVLVDASGRLQQVQILGSSVLSATNPEPNISNIQQMILSGQGYSATTGKVASAANMAGQFWVPNTSAKNVLIWSVRTSYSNANQTEQLQYLTTQDATLTGAGSVNDSANFLNLKGGGGAAASGATLIHNGGIGSATGTPLDFFDTPLTGGIELLAPGMFILIPAGTAGGIAVYSVTTAAGSWSFTVRFCEY
jgi:hypothetical protein